jgi:hypothetical protein
MPCLRSPLRLALALSLLAGCYVSDTERSDAEDRDGDGYRSLGVPGGNDCDDDDITVHPGAFESCLDSIDSDCDGVPCPLRQERPLDPDAVWALGGPGAACR